MTQNTRTDGRYRTTTDMVECDDCGAVSIEDVRIDSVPGIAAVTCPECDTTQEPSHPRVDGDMVDGAIRTRVIAFVSGVDHVAEGVNVSLGPDGTVLVAGNSHENDVPLVVDLAEACNGEYETGRAGALAEWFVTFDVDAS